MSHKLNSHIVNATYSDEESKCEFGPLHMHLFCTVQASWFYILLNTVCFVWCV